MTITYRPHQPGCEGKRQITVQTGTANNQREYAEVGGLISYGPRTPGGLLARQGVRFEIHFEKLRNRVDGAGAVPFEASLESFTGDERDGIRWCSRDLIPPILKRAAALFADGFTVREVAAILRVSKSEAGRLRMKAMDDGLLSSDQAPEDRQATVQ